MSGHMQTDKQRRKNRGAQHEKRDKWWRRPWKWKTGSRHRESQQHYNSLLSSKVESDTNAESTVQRPPLLVQKEKEIDRWSVGWTEENDCTPEQTVSKLGDHAAKRYRQFRRSVEKLDKEETSQELFGLLLSAESICDDMRVFEKETSALVCLAQTGSQIRQLRRLYAVLDAAEALCEAGLDDAERERMEWKSQLSEERRVRAAWYHRELKHETSGTATILAEINTEAKSEEVMTLLKGAAEKYGPTDGDDAADTLFLEELRVMETAFKLVAYHSNIIVMTLPTWFALPFEFGATFGLSMWGADRFAPRHTDEERFVREASAWSDIIHPHVAKFLGACHVGVNRFMAHEKVRSMAAYASIEGTERKAVWRRMFEVGLALQFMLERGFTIQHVEAAHLYCAQYEERAVLLGTHQFDALTEYELKPSGQQAGNQGRRVLDSSLVNSLVSTVINFFESSAESPNYSQTSLPVLKPSCLDEREWSSLTKLVANTNCGFLPVIEILGELGEVRDSFDWLEYLPMLKVQASSMCDTPSGPI